MELLANGATFETGVTLYRGVGTFDTTPILAGPWCEIPSSPTGRIIQTVCPDVLMNLIPLLIVHGLADTASHAWSGSLAGLPVFYPVWSACQRFPYPFAVQPTPAAPLSHPGPPVAIRIG